MQPEKNNTEKLSIKSRGILYHLKQSLQINHIQLETHLANIFKYRKTKFSKKDFHKIIKKYDSNLIFSQIDELFQELRDSETGHISYQNLQNTLKHISEYDNPAKMLNRTSVQIQGDNSGKQYQSKLYNSCLQFQNQLDEPDVIKNSKITSSETLEALIELKDRILQIQEYHMAIEAFITEKEGFLNRQNIIEIMKSFDFNDPRKRQLVLECFFEGNTKNKIDFQDLLQTLKLQHNALRINLSDFSIEESIILEDYQKQQTLKQKDLIKNGLNAQTDSVILSSVFSKKSDPFQSGIYRLQKIPQQLAPYYNYGSVLEEQFANLASSMIKKPQLFIDTQNPPYSKAVRWLHMAQINPKYELFEVAASILDRQKDRKGLGMILQPKDIIQGSMGDCYFLSAIAAIVYEYPELVYRLFVLEKNPSHIYGVRLFIQGTWKTIAVDAYFPIGKSGKFSGAQPHHNQIWVMLLEKAWAKVFKSYDNIHSGYNQEGLIAISGAPVLIVSSRSEGFLKKIEVQFARGSILTCATSKEVIQLTQKQQNELGVFSGHAYTLLKIYSNLKISSESKQLITLIKIKNPWGKKAWKGQWSYQSKKWTKELRDQTNFHKNPEDGTFFISLQDFIIYFDHINISRVNLGHRNSWFIMQNANRDQFYYNTFEVQSQGDYYFTLYQENRRKYKNNSTVYEKSKTWMFLIKLCDNMQPHDEQQIQTVACHTSVHRDNTIDTTLKPGRYLLISRVNWNYWDAHNYTISSYGPEKFNFSQQKLVSAALLNKLIYSRSLFIAKNNITQQVRYQNLKITKRLYFQTSQGIGFICITNLDTVKLETTIKLQSCKGIQALPPHKLPISMRVLPNQTAISCFIVDPCGYSYKVRQKYEIYTNQGL